MSTAALSLGSLLSILQSIPRFCSIGLVPTPSQSKYNLLASILHSSRPSPLLLKADQHLCRISSPAGTAAKPAATERASFLHYSHQQRLFRGWSNCRAHSLQLTACSILNVEPKMCRDSSFFQQQFSLNTESKASFSFLEDSRSVRPQDRQRVPAIAWFVHVRGTYLR